MKGKHAGWIRVLLIIIPYFIIVGAFQLLGFWATGIAPADFKLEQSSLNQLTMSAFSLLGTTLVVWLFVRFVEKNKFINIGLSLKSRQAELLQGILAGTIIMGLGFVFLAAAKELTFVRFIFNLRELAITIALFSVVSLTEEVFLRGYVLRNLMASFNKYVALLISAILFSLMHAFNPNVNTLGLVNILLAGLLLGITYIHSQNLWFPIGLHFSWNLLQTWLGFNVSGQNTYSLLEISLGQNKLLSGGEFGFEGSLLASVLQCMAIVFLAFYYSRKEKRRA